MSVKTHELICIVCPKGCHLTVTEEDGEFSVEGNLCKRGDAYGKKEITNPTRVVTSTVKVKDSKYRRLPVVTKGEVPKGKIFEAMAEINEIEVQTPIKVGDVIIEGILGTDINLVASRSID